MGFWNNGQAVSEMGADQTSAVSAGKTFFATARLWMVKPSISER
jgi:hypothetical protein